MEPMLIVVFVFVAILITLIFAVCIAYCYSRSNKKGASGRLTRTEQTEEASGPGPSLSGGHHPSYAQPSSGLKSGSKTRSAEHLEGSPTLHYSPNTRHQHKRSAEKSLMKTPNTKSAGEKSSTGKDRLKLKHFKFNGTHKKFSRLSEASFVHAFSRFPANHTPVAKIDTKEIKGDITMYSSDFTLNLPMIASTRKKAEILEHYYHLDSQSMDNAVYKRKRTESCMIPEPVPVEGNHERVKNLVEGIPCFELRPHLAKMPAKRDDTIRHFLLNTQYAARLAVRFVCASGRYTCIPSHEIVEPCGRLRVVIVANHDMDEAPEKEVAYFEYTQVPERAQEAAAEFVKRPVIGRVALRLFPNMLNLSPNTFYPSTRRRTIVYTATLTNSGKTPCKFSWPDERDVIVSPQTGFIKPHSSVQFSFTLKKPVATTALVAEMKYALNDKPNAQGTITARFETADMKRLIQLSTKALAACDTAEDPGGYVG